MKNKLGSAILVLLPSLAMAAGHPLNGDYELDFFSSSGDCAQRPFVRSSDTGVEMNIWQFRHTGYRIGAYCHERIFGGEHASIDKCTDVAETNILSDSNRAFESAWSSLVTINGVVQRKTFTRFTMRLVLDGRLQSDLVRIEQKGSQDIEIPYFRCFYNKVE